MKSAILSLLAAAKVMAFAGMAVAAVAEGQARLLPAPTSLSVATEALSGGYRRKGEGEDQKA